MIERVDDGKTIVGSYHENQLLTIKTNNSLDMKVQLKGDVAFQNLWFKQLKIRT